MTVTEMLQRYVAVHRERAKLAIEMEALEQRLRSKLRDKNIYLDKPITLSVPDHPQGMLVVDLCRVSDNIRISWKEVTLVD